MSAPYQILPQLAQDDLQRLKASILDRGVEVPVIVDENGTIIDGHHRAMIADSLGIEFPKEVRTGLSEAQKRLLAVELNMARRQLTDAQKVLLAEQMKPDVQAVAKAKQQEHGGTAPGRNTSGNISGSVPKGSNDTREVLAKTVGYKQGKTLEAHSKLLEQLRAEADGEQLIKHVESGDWDISDVRKELRSRDLKRREPDPVPRSAPPLRPLFNEEREAAMAKSPEPAPMDGADAALAIMRLVGVETADAEDTASFLVHLDKDLDSFSERMVAITAKLGEVVRHVSRLRREARAAA